MPYRLLFLTLLIVLTSTFTSMAQKRRADHHFEHMNYGRAAELYTKVVEKKPSTYAYDRLVTCYWNMRNFQKAEKALEAMQEKTGRINPKHHKMYAEVLLMNGQVEQAKKEYAAYLEKHEKGLPLKEWIAEYEALAEHSVDERVQMEPALALNTPNSDMCAIRVGEQIYYMSEHGKADLNHHNATGAMYYAIWKVPALDQLNERREENLAGLLKGKSHSNYHDGPLSYDSLNHIMYFSRAKRSVDFNVKQKRTEHPQLYQAKWSEDGSWSEIQALPFNDEDFTLSHPAISADGKTLYFASDRPGGQGKSDIYKVSKQDDKWGQPKNLGAPVNTEGSELFPYVAADGSLYFASDGHPNFGGLDLFIFTDGEVENLKQPINSTADDFAFYWLSEDKGKALMNSNRVGGKGEDDIYILQIKPEAEVEPETIATVEPEKPKKKEPKKKEPEMIEAAVSFEVYKMEDGDCTPMKEPILAQIYKEDGTQLFSDSIRQSFTYDTQLEFGKKYYLVGKKEHYLALRVNFEPNKEQIPNQIDLTLEMDPIELEKEYEVENIFYEFDKAKILPKSKPALRNLLSILKDNPTVEIELGAHTDERGDKAYNQDLSQRRAQAVVDYLVENGIDENRITAKGYGEEKPLVENASTEEEHQLNRRTEFKILEE